MQDCGADCSTASGTHAHCSFAGTCDAIRGAATLDPPCECAENFAGAHCEVCAASFAGAHCEIDCSTASGTHAHCSSAGTCDASDG